MALQFYGACILAPKFDPHSYNFNLIWQRLYLHTLTPILFYYSCRRTKDE